MQQQAGRVATSDPTQAHVPMHRAQSCVSESKLVEGTGHMQRVSTRAQATVPPWTSFTPALTAACPPQPPLPHPQPQASPGQQLQHGMCWCRNGHAAPRTGTGSTLAAAALSHALLHPWLLVALPMHLH